MVFCGAWGGGDWKASNMKRLCQNGKPITRTIMKHKLVLVVLTWRDAGEILGDKKQLMHVVMILLFLKNISPEYGLEFNLWSQEACG